jgi:hypothetical protein
MNVTVYTDCRSLNGAPLKVPPRVDSAVTTAASVDADLDVRIDAHLGRAAHGLQVGACRLACRLIRAAVPITSVVPDRSSG